MNTVPMRDEAAPSGAAGVGHRLIVQVRWGPLAGLKAIVLPGHTLRVGRAEPAELVVPGDARLSETHFEIAWDGGRCRLRDLRSGAGTQLGGEVVREADVPHGGWVRAGATDFYAYFEDETPPQEPAMMTAFKSRTLEVLRSQAEPLLAVLDAARDARILVLLRESVEECRSLYEGSQGDVLEDIAPYLVSIPKDSRLLEALVQEGWGRHWGVFLTSRLPFKDVRRHLRKFLMVRDPANQELYFRFYDPRVLRIFLPACTPEQTQAFFEGVQAYLMEGEDQAHLVRFTRQEDRMRPEEMLLETATQ